MRLSGSLVLVAVACLVALSADAAQGPKTGRRPANRQGGSPTTGAQGPKTHAQGPKTQGPKADHPQGPKGDRTAEGPRDGRSRRRGASASEPQTIAANISRNPVLQARVKEMLPPDTSLEQASRGFRSQGEFIAALEASKNQNIPFNDLKAEMTGDSALSLGQAIQKLRPGTEQQPETEQK